MRTLEYSCGKCGKEIEVLASVKDPIVIPQCHGAMEWTPTKVPRGTFKYTAGKETGVYDYDYGKKATWDLTVPGKFERLMKDGVVSDPFREYDDDVKSGKKQKYQGKDFANDPLEG